MPASSPPAASASPPEPSQALLDAAQLWVRDPETGAPRLLAGWEDAHPFCAAVCTTSVGLAYCRRCPIPAVGRAMASGRAAAIPCQAGIRLLAVPAPRGSDESVVVLRCGRPERRRLTEVAATVHVPLGALRRAAREAPEPDGRTILAAARFLRDEARLRTWQAALRDRAAERRRMATAAIAQMLATGDELLEHWRLAERQRRRLAAAERRLDRLAQELVATRANERAAVAHLIHDTAAQSLVSAHRFLQAALGSAAVPDLARGHLDEASARLATAIGELRTILERLAPPALEELGLRRAIEERLRNLAPDGSLVWSVEGDLPRLPTAVEQALFAMVAEAASNVVRHAEARRATIELGIRAGRVVVTVADDGRGFEPGAVGAGETRGLGLEGLRRQASWLGGRATIRSRPGAGARIRISIPLSRDGAGRGRRSVRSAR
jgi:signal transduction histidine kinase